MGMKKSRRYFFTVFVICVMLISLLTACSNDSDGDNGNGSGGGGNNAPEGTPAIITKGDTAYVKQDSGDVALDFADGYVTIVHDSFVSGRDYEVYNDRISIKLDKEGSDYAFIVPLQSMEIVDLCTLKDQDGNIYAIADSQGQELVTRNFYYLNDDVNAPAYIFYDDGTVNLEADGKEAVSGTYKVEDTTVSIDIEGGPVNFEIINKRVLKAEDGAIYYR